MTGICLRVKCWRGATYRTKCITIIGPIQIYSGAEVSHTNRCRSVRRTLRHRCRSVRRTFRHQCRSVRTLRHYNLVPNCPGAEVSRERQNSSSGQSESRSHSSNSEHAYGEIADLILALTKTKTNTNPNRYRRNCPDPNARIQKTEELQIKTENINLRLWKYKRCIFLILPSRCIIWMSLLCDRRTRRMTPLTATRLTRSSRITFRRNCARSWNYRIILRK